MFCRTFCGVSRLNGSTDRKDGMFAKNVRLMVDTPETTTVGDDDLLHEKIEHKLSICGQQTTNDHGAKQTGWDEDFPY